MKEDFLHYVWQFKKFDFSNLQTAQGSKLEILNSGLYLKHAGPDFFNAQVIIDNQKWAGNVEIHIKSSDWYVHRHEHDANYDNVILHVVWEHDVEVFRKDNSEIPVLEIKNYVSKHCLENYMKLTTTKTWIFCEKEIASVDSFIFKNFQEKLFFERLERKSIPIQKILEETGNDWEAALFCLLAKNFGLNTNGEVFLKIAQSIPFSIVRKESFEVENLEALLFGRSGLLSAENEDLYFKDLKFRYDYAFKKYQFHTIYVDALQFFKHRPDNFPTIRLSQFANLYHSRLNLFSSVINAETLPEYYALFRVEVSEYWNTHYQFDKISPKKKKSLTTAFIDLLLINTIIPLKFAYAKSQGKDISEQLIDLMQEIQAEKNVIIEKFSGFGIKSENAYESQSLLQLKNEYCNAKRCLECAVGMELMRS